MEKEQPSLSLDLPQLLSLRNDSVSLALLALTTPTKSHKLKSLRSRWFLNERGQGVPRPSGKCCHFLSPPCNLGQLSQTTSPDPC